MNLEIITTDGEAQISIQPTTVEESTALARLAIRGNFTRAEATLNFNANGKQTFNITTPLYPSRTNRGYSMIRNKDLKVI